jgi:hypothetical protein
VAVPRSLVHEDAHGHAGLMPQLEFAHVAGVVMNQNATSMPCCSLRMRLINGVRQFS